jgi:proline iminopeptidase
MKKFYLLLIFLFLILSFVCFGESPKLYDENVESLWPEIEPFKTGYLEVTEFHEIYYEMCGHPKGKPVFVLHGGPGGKCTPYYRRFFNPDKFLIVLFDQRGCGKSKPVGEIRQNTTQDLINDIEKLRVHLNLDQIIVFGGSWGSTLGLAYSEKFPENVIGLVLRGIFTATEEEMTHIHHVIPKFFPVEYSHFVSALPEPNKIPTADYIFEVLNQSDEKTKEKIVNAWMNYESKTNMLEAPEGLLEDILSSSSHKDLIATLKIQLHYVNNHFFMKDGQIMRDADKISQIPAILVNGRYDMYCPPTTAYRLHKMLQKSKLVIVENAGHWMGEKPIEQELIKAMNIFE